MPLYKIHTYNRFYWARYIVTAESPDHALAVIEPELIEQAREDERANEGNDPTPSEHYEYEASTPELITEDDLRGHERDILSPSNRQGWICTDSGGNG